MASTKTVWGIDVGQCALKALRLRWRDNRLQAVGFDVIEHAKILSQPDADEQQLIQSALGKFASRNSLKGSTIVISVPGQASFTRFIKLPPVEPKKVPEIVRYEARQQIPFDLEDVVWDHQTIGEPGAGPREVEVGIFAMKRDIVTDYVSDFLAMKIEPDIVQMAPVALYNFLKYDKHEGGGATILIDVGAENTSLVIAEADRVWIRPVPLGGNNFTNALCKAFKLPFAKAENLKRHAAESKHARQVFQAMRPIFGDLLTEVQRSIGYYTSLHRDSRIQRVVAMGNAFRLPGLRKFLAQSLGVEVEKVEGFNSLPDSPALNAPLFRENALSFGVAFGLAIQGLGLATIRTSLLPPEILSQKIMRKKRPFFVGAAAVLVVALGCFAYDQVKTFGEIEGTPGEVGRLVKEVGGLAQKNEEQQRLFDEQKAALREQQEKMAELEGLVGNQTYAYDLLRTVWETLPYDERWRTWKPDSGVARSNLNIVELLELTMHYVPDVRTYSEAATADRRGLESIEVLPFGQKSLGGDEREEPAAEPEESAEAVGPAGPTPGVLIHILGITPKTGRDGLNFVNNRLIEVLKQDPRTARLRIPQGMVEELARIRSTDRFGSRPEYGRFVGEPKTTRASASGAEVQPRPARIDRSGDFWFEAEWLVRIPPKEGAGAEPADVETTPEG